MVPSFDRFRSDLLELYAPPARAEHTCQKVRQVLDLLRDECQLSSPSELTPLAVARFIRVAGQGRNANTLIGLLGYLKAICGYAAYMGYIDRSPFAYRRQWLRPERSREKVHHAREDIERVLSSLRAGSGEWAGHRLYALAMTYTFAALRRNEALYLRVADVDWARHVLWIEPHQRLKTEGSQAPVPLAPQLAEALAGWLPACGSEWVFPNLSRRGPWVGGACGQRAGDRLVRAGEAVGVRHFTPLSLRHSFATHAEHWGLSEVMVQRILRHTTPRTQRVYRHADLTNMVEAMEAVRLKIA